MIIVDNLFCKVLQQSQKTFFFCHMEDGNATDVWIEQAVTRKTSSCPGTENGESIFTLNFLSIKEVRKS